MQTKHTTIVILFLGLAGLLSCNKKLVEYNPSNATSSTVWSTPAGFVTNVNGAASTYTGQTTIVSGIVNAQSATALGTSAAVLVAGTGAALQLQSVAGIANSRALLLNGTGVNGGGHRLAAGATLNGPFANAVKQALEAMRPAVLAARATCP